jgi:hypothetical protein
VTDGEQLARCAGFGSRNVTKDGSAQDEMKDDGKACRSGNPSPPAPSISPELQHPTHPRHHDISIVNGRAEDAASFPAAKLFLSVMYR